jgi:hypothetical protein
MADASASQQDGLRCARVWHLVLGYRVERPSEGRITAVERSARAALYDARPHRESTPTALLLVATSAAAATSATATAATTAISSAFALVGPSLFCL